MNRIVCAWCKEVLVDGDPQLPASHGICRPCAKAVTAHAAAAERIIDTYRAAQKGSEA
jgi:hypothetical protein